MSEVGTLVLLRHGESEWNAKNLFTGWVDVDLSARGEAEARRGGELIRESGLLPDVVHTSVLLRAIRTAEIALHAADRLWLPVLRHWRLNERHYGALQGKNKKQTLEQYGEEQFMLWRRSYDTPPPPIADGDEWSQAGDPRYASLPPELMPRTECLKDVVSRMLPYWYDYIDGISDEAIAALNIPTGIPLRYDLDATMRPRTPGGVYLDPEAATEAAAAVANQGR